MGVIALITFNSRTAPEDATIVDSPTDRGTESGYLTFEAYQLGEELYRGDIAAVDFTDREDARTYQSIIEEGMKKVSVNFAGAYSVVTWGCGANCQVSTIVDVRTGKIIEYGIVSAYGLAYSPWSSLFIVNPIENIPVNVANEEGISSDFYTLTSTSELEYIRRHVAGIHAPPTCDTATASARNAFTREIRDFSCSIPYGWEVIEDAL